MAIHVLENYVTLEDYAKLCNISKRSVQNRIRAGTVRGTLIDGVYAVNTGTNPPVKFAHHKLKKTSGGATQLHSELRAVVPWCNRKGIRSYPYLRAIITGKIDGWVMAEEVFARAADLEALQKTTGK